MVERSAHYRARYGVCSPLIRVIQGVVFGAAAWIAGPVPVEGAPAELGADAVTEQPTLQVVTAERGGWPEAATAIRFELEQAGYVLVAPGSPHADARLVIARDGEVWRIELTDRRGQVHPMQGPATQDAALVGLQAVELVLVSGQVRPLVEPEPELDKEPEPEPEPAPELDKEPEPASSPGRQPPWIALAADEDLRDVVTAAPERPAPPRTWMIELGSSVASIGVVGVSLGVRHRWTQLEVGLTGEGAPLTRRSEETDVDTTRAVTGGGVARLRLGGAYVFRPGRRVRPSVGLASELMVPILKSSYRGPDPDDGLSESTLDRSGVYAGCLWVPSAEIGVRVGLRPRAALWIGARAGPTVSVVPVALAYGGELALPSWFVGATTGLIFGPT